MPAYITSGGLARATFVGCPCCFLTETIAEGLLSWSWLILVFT